MSKALLDPQESEKVFSIVGDSDPFRVVIRGSAIIEDQLKKVVDAAFRDGTPSDLRGLRVPSQLALAEALGFVSPEVVSAIKELRRIRHRIAHGSNEEITPDDVRALRKAVEHVFGKDLRTIEQTDENPLGVFLFAIWYAIGSDAEYALQGRAEADEALASRKMKGVPLEDIRKLLESDSSAAL
jgi:hypothetical protein